MSDADGRNSKVLLLLLTNVSGSCYPPLGIFVVVVVSLAWDWGRWTEEADCVRERRIEK